MSMRILMLGLLLAFTACDIQKKSSTTKKVLPSGFVTEGALFSPLAHVRSHIHWIDNENILFIEAGELNPNFPGGSKKIHIWNYVTGETYKVGETDTDVCLRDQKMRYGRRTNSADKLSVKQFARKLLFENNRYRLGDEVLIGDLEYVLDQNCNLVPRPGTFNHTPNTRVLAEYGLLLKPIENEVEKYSKNRRLGVYKGNNLIKILPIRENQIYLPAHSAFNNSYLIKSGYQRDPKSIGMGGWPTEMREVSYILNEQLQLTKVLLPDSWSKARNIAFYLTPVGIVSGGYDKHGDIYRGGLFLLWNNRVTTIVYGNIYMAKIDSSGCKIAFIYGGEGLHKFREKMENRKLQVVKLCEEGEAPVIDKAMTEERRRNSIPSSGRGKLPFGLKKH